MIGRAGRPGFDTSGTAIVLTDNASKKKYQELSGGLEVIESHLPMRLMDALNTEMSQRVITSVKAALDWIKATFFFRRVKENPEKHGLASESDIDCTSKGCAKSHFESCTAKGLSPSMSRERLRHCQDATS